MPRPLLTTGPAGNPSEIFTNILTFAALSFFATLTAGVSAYKMLTWRGEKLVLMASRFAAGVFLGTAMMDLLSESDIFFHWLGLRYPMAFLFSCTGYGVAMLVDCLLARFVRRLSRGCFKKFRLKSFDEFIISMVSDLESTKCCDTTTVPAGTTKSETKDCDGIGYLRYLILYRATLIVDFLFLLYPLSVLSMLGGTEIGSAKTKTLAWRAFLNATLHNVIYMVSLVFTGLRFTRSIRFVVCLFLMVLFSTLSPIGTMIKLLIWNNESSLGSAPGEPDNDWTVGIFFGLLSGILVYLSVHHLLADGYELERSVSDTRFGKFVAMVAGVGLIALVKVLDM